jgi:proteasome activator subunit 4
MTATHQLEIVVMSTAFVGRSLLLTSLSSSSINPVHLGGGNVFINLLMVSLSNALLGMDANDPPKTLATMQLIGSIFSNVSTQARHSSRRGSYAPTF